MIDSERVPWGKGEKQPGEGDEIVSETVYLQWAEADSPSGDVQSLYAYWRMSLRVTLCGKVKGSNVWSQSESESE